jgi:3-oxoadipate enol-lactonase
MSLVERRGQPALYYELDDYTDPWRNAPTIVLQHGFARSSKFWYQWVPYLSRFYKVIRTDLRGLGRSSKDFDVTTGFSAALWIADLEAILDHAGVDSVHYCGESTGGIIGMLFAAERPQRVRTLSLISAPVRLNETAAARVGVGETALRQLGPMAYARAKNGVDRFPPGTDPGLMAWFAGEQGLSDLEVMINMQKFTYGLDTTPYLARIAAPTLVIYPSHDTHSTPGQEETLKKNVRNLRLVHLPSHYHNLHCTQPASCATQVLHFAAQHDGIVCREN